MWVKFAFYKEWNHVCVFCGDECGHHGNGMDIYSSSNPRNLQCIIDAQEIYNYWAKKFSQNIVSIEEINYQDAQLVCKEIISLISTSTYKKKCFTIKLIWR